jgi:hypothetical protein
MFSGAVCGTGLIFLQASLLARRATPLHEAAEASLVKTKLEAE